MSIQAVAWVLGSRSKQHPAHPARDSERLVLLALANHANDYYECYPSVASIAWESQVSERRVHDALRRMEKKGWITRTLNAAPDERIPTNRRPNLYRIVTDIPGMDAASTPEEVWGGQFGTFGVDDRVLGVDSSAARGGRSVLPNLLVEPSARESSENRRSTCEKCGSTNGVGAWVTAEDGTGVVRCPDCSAEIAS